MQLVVPPESWKDDDGPACQYEKKYVYELHRLFMETKKLKSLSEFNEERLAIHLAKQPPRFNGIACPDCSNELQDEFTGVRLFESTMSEPSKVNIFCTKCGYKGTRYA